MKSFFYIIFFFIFTSISHAESKVVFLDVNFIYTNSEAGKKLDKEIQTRSNKINKEITKYETEIKDDEEKILKQKNILSDEEFKNNSIKLQQKAIKYNKIIASKRDELIKFRDKAKIEFYNQLMKITSDYSNKNSIDMIIKKEQILIGKKELDSTQEILNLFNKNVNIINVK
tara:strand:+ start:2461 stop:2976 length:516 start_codon:yes stop_codon:yes gene_type:complete